MRPPPTITALCLAACAAHAAPGDLDTSFGTTGRVTIDIGTVVPPPVTDPPTPPPPAPPGEGSAIAVQPDGKIVIAGLSENKATVVRLKDDGTLDTTFNTTGKAPVSFGNSKDYMRDIAVFPNGRIVVAGYSNALSGDFTFALGRLNPDGTILGTTLSSGTKYGGGLALHTDGKMVIVGHNVIARYTDAGVLDSTFDGDGRAVFNFDPPSQVSGAAVQPDGKIVAVGTASGSPPNAFVAGRYNVDGSPDTTFGTGGYVRTRVNSLSSAANRVAIMPDGKIVVAGSTFVPAPDTRDFAVVRYHPDGSLDTSFNGTGIATASVGQNDGVEARMAVQPDGKILVGGNTGLVRFNTDGTLDTSFSGDGKVPTDYVLTGIAMQPNGRIVLTGGNGKLVAERLLSGLAPDISVEDSGGNSLTSGTATVDFGTMLSGESKTLIFTVKNTGFVNLTGLAVSKAAAGTPESFTPGSAPASTLAPGVSATFTVTFSSTTAGTRTATLNIASNDPDENPFVVQLTGVQNSVLETWRYQHFGSTANTGPGADSSDPDGDGLVNLMEFATGTHPLQISPPAVHLIKDGGDFEFNYTRPKAALADVSYRVESSSTFDTWSTDGLGPETILPGGGATEQVRVTFTAEGAGKRFVRLKVTRR